MLPDLVNRYSRRGMIYVELYGKLSYGLVRIINPPSNEIIADIAVENNWRCAESDDLGGFMQNSAEVRNPGYVPVYGDTGDG